MTVRSAVVALCAALVLTGTGAGAHAAPRATGTGVATLTAVARTVAPVPPLTRTQRDEGLVDVRSVVPDAVVDLRYATTRNFTHVRLYPVHARCLVHRSMVAGLRGAARILRAHDARLVFWDCYRPHAVQVRMYRVVPDPTWVARPHSYATSHEAARSVDVTFASAACLRRRHHTLGGCLADMGTGFDAFTPRAYAYATEGLIARQVQLRAKLRSAFQANGLSVYSGEWWHFDGPGSLTPRPLLKAGLL